jgi:signal transduction histidine kinase
MPDEFTSTRSAASAAVDRLLLPPLRQRAREALVFLVLSQSVYLVALLFSPGESLTTRAGLNLFRLLVLVACVHQLRGEGSRRQTLALEAIGLGTQLAVGAAISVVRQDVMPMALLTVAICLVSSTVVPWGLAAQAVLVAGSAASIFVASVLVHHETGFVFGFDLATTMTVTLGITLYIAHFLEGARRSLEEHLDEARRRDEELAALRRELERRVAERTAELEMANRELEGFSYTVSHDLRSPLRTIAGFSQMILDESGASLDEAARDHLSKIRAASRRMDDLIDDMLLLARVGRTALRYETVEVAKLAASIGAQLSAEEPDRRVEFTVGGIPPVPADHGLLKIALDNLLRNAWKFTSGREAARVTVSGEGHGDRVLVRVEDNGVGFDPRFRHKLFLPFQRLHDHEDFPGTGVGLATVARIVRRHGGEVDASSDGENGAVFTITLPAKRPS